MPFIRDIDEDKYYDKEELRQIVRGTGLFPPGFKGNGLFPSGSQPSGYGYQIVGEGVIDGLASVLQIAKTNKNIIKGIVDTAGEIVSTVKSHAKTQHAVHPVHKAEVINKDALSKLRKKAGLSTGSGFRFD